MATLLASTQHRDVSVSIGGTAFGVADTHSPGDMTNSVEAHWPGGSQGWRVLAGKGEIAEGTLEFTYDPDTDFWKLQALTNAVASDATISIVDVHRSPTSGVVGSRKYTGVVSTFTDPDSDSAKADAMKLTIKYLPTSLPTS